MKSLIVEDNLTNRLILQGFLRQFGPEEVAVDGFEAVQAVYHALEASQPYDLICLDIMLPHMDGQTALRQIRDLEAQRGIFSSQGAKIVMTTALEDMNSVMTAYNGLCDGYLVKPIDKANLLGELRRLALIPNN
jgi:two-component system, chemotaxis family, chemotaxis protein CheY